jgi:predicted transcriptional regulator YdeE
MNHSKFDIIGITVRTTNQNGKSSIDIPELWKKFFTEAILEKIPDKVDASIYCIYTDYEKDFTEPYTVILGCKVNGLKTIPKGMIGRTIPGGNFAKFSAKGDLTKGVVFTEWNKIWNSELNRKYTADFEVYGEKAQDPKNAEVDIFVAI